MKMSLIALLALGISAQIFAAPPVVTYNATIITFACITENNGHRCERLPDEAKESIVLSPETGVALWQKWVKAKKFQNNFDFNLGLRLSKNSDGVTYTLSSAVANPWVGAFDLGQVRMKLDSLEAAPKEWMVGSSEVPVGDGKSYSVRMILTKAP